MVTWQVDQDKWLAILTKWSSMTPEQRADAGKGAKIVGRRHDLASRRGVMILESADAAAVHRYLGQWNPFLDVGVVAPVTEDEEAAAVAKAIVADHAG